MNTAPVLLNMREHNALSVVAMTANRSYRLLSAHHVPFEVLALGFASRDELNEAASREPAARRTFRTARS